MPFVPAWLLDPLPRGNEESRFPIYHSMGQTIRLCHPSLSSSLSPHVPIRLHRRSPQSQAEGSPLLPRLCLAPPVQGRCPRRLHAQFICRSYVLHQEFVLLSVLVPSNSETASLHHARSIRLARTLLAVSLPARFSLALHGRTM
jgi:hypothetical protein